MKHPIAMPQALARSASGIRSNIVVIVFISASVLTHKPRLKCRHLEITDFVLHVVLLVIGDRLSDLPASYDLAHWQFHVCRCRLICGVAGIGLLVRTCIVRTASPTTLRRTGILHTGCSKNLPMRLNVPPLRSGSARLPLHSWANPITFIGLLVCIWRTSPLVLLMNC